MRGRWRMYCEPPFQVPRNSEPLFGTCPRPHRGPFPFHALQHRGPIRRSGDTFHLGAHGLIEVELPIEDQQRRLDLALPESVFAEAWRQRHHIERAKVPARHRRCGSTERRLRPSPSCESGCAPICRHCRAGSRESRPDHPPRRGILRPLAYQAPMRAVCRGAGAQTRARSCLRLARPPFACGRGLRPCRLWRARAPGRSGASSA